MLLHLTPTRLMTLQVWTPNYHAQLALHEDDCCFLADVFRQQMYFHSVPNHNSHLKTLYIVSPPLQTESQWFTDPLWASGEGKKKPFNRRKPLSESGSRRVAICCDWLEWGERKEEHDAKSFLLQQPSSKPTSCIQSEKMKRSFWNRKSSFFFKWQKGNDRSRRR